MPALAGLRESGAARRVPGVSADKPSKGALHRRPIGEPRQNPAALQGPAEAFAGTEDSRRQIAASMPHASGPTDRRPRPRLSKRPRKRPWGGQLRRRKYRERNAAPGRRRGKEGGDVRGPQGDDVAQAGRDHEAQEQGAARAARDDPDGGVRGVHGRARLPGRAAHEGEPRGEGQHHEDPVRGLHGEIQVSLGAGEEGERPGEGGAR